MPMEALLVACTIAIIVVVVVTRSREDAGSIDRLKRSMEVRMSALTDAVDALTAGIQAHAMIQQAALDRLQEDVTAMRAQIDSGAGASAEMTAAAERIQSNLAILNQSTATLAALDIDPNNPVVPPPPADPGTGGTTPADPGAGGGVTPDPTTDPTAGGGTSSG